MVERFLSYLIYVSIPALFSIWAYLTHNNVGFLYLFFSFLFFYACLFIPCFCYESWIEKYGEFSSIKFRSTYQYSSRFLPLLLLGFSSIILSVSNLFNHLDIGILLFFSFIPSFGLFFKTDVFNESNCYLYDEIVLGYPPHYYGLISVIMGVYEVYTIQNFINSDFNLVILSLIITWIFQFIIISPNLINLIFPFEIRKTEGFVAFIVITIFLYLITLNLLTGSSLSNTNISITVPNIIPWIIGIIIGILIIRQRKKMDEK